MLTGKLFIKDGKEPYLYGYSFVDQIIPFSNKVLVPIIVKKL